jgi:hypothetical protein
MTAAVIYKEQTTEYALGRIVDINTGKSWVGRGGWVQWRLLEYYPIDFPDRERADRFRALLVEIDGCKAETYLHWPTLCAMLEEGSALME